MLDWANAKLKEEQFIERLRENLAGVENASGIQAGDNLAELRKLTGGRLLRSELETKYPLGKLLSMRVMPKGGMFKRSEQPIVLAGKVIIRLDRFVEKGSDSEPISLSDLNTLLSKESDLANRSRYESVLGLFSPTGWVEDAKKFIENDPPGSGWASNRICPILIGPEITELVWDKNSNKVADYILCFCGLTLDERTQICKQQLERDILLQEFADLQKIAKAKGFDINFVKNVSRKLAAESKQLTLREVAGVGLVLKKKI